MKIYTVYKIRILFFIMTASFAGCNHPIWTAHRFNEKGISDYEKGKYKKARPHYEKSIAQRYRENIPVYNLGINYFATGNYSAAHEYYERALAIEPSFPEALYNDGHTLYMWGMSLLDRNFCNIKKTVELWQKSISRFRGSMNNRESSSEIKYKSEEIISFIGEQLDAVNLKHEKNREKCESKSKKKKQKKKEKKENKSAGTTGSKTQAKEGIPGAGGGASGTVGDGDETDGNQINMGEMDRINAAIRRIKKDSGNFIFKQTKPQQLRKEKGKENIGEVISW